MFYNKYPYTDMFELNLDWLLSEFNKLTGAFDQVQQNVIDMQAAIDSFYDWFNTLDVSDEINAKINKMIASGEFQAIVESRLDPVVRTELNAQIPHIVTDWLQDHITQDPNVVIDDSLSVSGAAADAFAAGLFVKGLAYNNCFDFLTIEDHNDTTSHSVNFTFNSDGSVSVDGTATGGNAMCNIYYDEESLPSWVVPGKTYYGFCTKQDDIIFEIYTYKNNTFQQEWRFNSVTEPYPFTIPDDAEGMLIRLRVLENTTVNRTVLIHVNSGLNNDQLTAQAGDNLQFKGVYPDASSLDNVPETGIYLLTGNTSAPGTGVGVLYHIVGSANVKTQTYFRFATLGIFYRRWLYGSGWNDWTYIDSQSEFVNPQACKYVAFGDSLVQGALWNDDGNGGHVTTYAPDNMKIPNRIATAVRATTLINMAHGGQGYITAAAPYPNLQNYLADASVQAVYADADLITIQAGINDGDYTAAQIVTAMLNCIDIIRSVNPKAQIMIISPTPYTSNNQPFDTYYAGGWSLRTLYNQASSPVTAKGVPYLVWTTCTLCQSWSDFSGADDNWGHPKTADIYKLMGDYIGGKVAALFKN